MAHCICQLLQRAKRHRGRDEVVVLNPEPWLSTHISARGNKVPMQPRVEEAK